MPRLLGFLVVVGSFGTGLATGALHFSAVAPHPAAQQVVVADWQQQVTVLQEQLRTQEAELTALRQRVQTLSEAQPVVGQSVPPVARPTRSEPRETLVPAPGTTLEETEAAPPAAEASPPPTEEAALSRVSKYLEETEGLGERERRAHMRALIRDLRAMGEPAVTALLQTLETAGDSRERRVAATVLGALRDVRALPALQAVVEREEDLMMRRAASYGLRLLQLPETAPVLTSLLANQQDDRFVRLHAAYGLAQLGEAQGVAGLVQIFDEAESDGRGRVLAFRSLMSLNDPAALPLMRQLAVSDADASYRVAAMRFLAAQGDQEALPLLQRVLESPREQPSVLDAAAQTHSAITSGQLPANTPRDARQSRQR